MCACAHWLMCLKLSMFHNNCLIAMSNEIKGKVKYALCVTQLILLLNVYRQFITEIVIWFHNSMTLHQDFNWILYVCGKRERKLPFKLRLLLFFTYNVIVHACYILHYANVYVYFIFSDAPNDSLYMIGGVCVAMFLVGVIIVLLAVTIRYVDIYVYEVCYFVPTFETFWGLLPTSYMDFVETVTYLLLTPQDQFKYFSKKPNARLIVIKLL